MPSLMTAVRNFAAGSMRAAASLVRDKANRGDVPETPQPHGGTNRRPGAVMASFLQKRPMFSLSWADLMRVDHQIRFAMFVRNGPAFGLKVKVDSPRPDVKQFVEEQWDRIWSQESEKLVRDQNYGYLGFETMYRYADGQYQFDRYLDRHPMDTKPLTLRDKLVGVRFSNLSDAKRGARSLFGPQALWLTYDAEHGSLFGNAILEPAFAPWWERVMENGATRMRQLRMIKDAYIGDQVYYEENGVFVTAAGESIPFRDVAVEAAENRMSGGVLVFPKRVNGNGSETKLIEYVGPTGVQGIAPIMEWVEALDWDILDALEIPREVVEASETGSGYSGRAVPNQKFLAGLNPKLSNRIRQVKEQTLVPLVAANMGADASDEFDIKLVPLEESMGESAGGPEAGKQPPPPQRIPPQPGQRPPQPGQPPQNKQQPQQFSAWDESKHPRDDHGKWTDAEARQAAKLVKKIIGTQAMTQKRAKAGGEIGPNGEHYPGGAFIATTDLPKRVKQKIQRSAGGKVVVEPGKFEQPEPGKMSILDKIGGKSFNHRDGKINYTFLEWQKSTTDEVAMHEELGKKYQAGERWVDVNDYPSLAGIDDAARLVVAGMPVPGAILDKFPDEWQSHLSRYKPPEKKSDDEFTLARESTKAKPKPAKFDNSDKTKQRKLLEGMDSLPGQMDLFAIQFRNPPSGEGRWITIGGRSDGDEKHKGGFPVQIDGEGRILKSGGPKSLIGKKLSGLKKHFSALRKKREKEATSFDPSEFEPKKRAVNVESRVGSAIADAAKYHGVDASDLAEAVDFVWKEKRDAIEAFESAKAAARNTTGLTAGIIEKWENSGKDHAKYPGFDVAARTAAWENPELGIGAYQEGRDDTDYAGRLWEILKEGKRTPPAKHDPDLIDEAAGYVLAGRLDDDELAELERARAVPFSVDDDYRQQLQSRIRGRLATLLPAR